MNKKDGGPAFPTAEMEWKQEGNSGRHGYGPVHCGMSIRDYIAVAVLNGILSRSFAGADEVDTTTETIIQHRVIRAYRYADAMLSARSK